MNTAYFRSGIGNYFFDVEFSESHEMENTITENPVLTGVSVNDHVYRQAISVTLDVGISDCLTGYNGSSGSTRSVDAFNKLMDFYKSAALVDVYTGLAHYSNMVVKSVTAKRDKSTMHAMRATVVLQELMIVGQTAVQISEVQTTPSGNKTADSTGSSLLDGILWIGNKANDANKAVASGAKWVGDKANELNKDVEDGVKAVGGGIASGAKTVGGGIASGATWMWENITGTNKKDTSK